MLNESGARCEAPRFAIAELDRLVAGERDPSLLSGIIAPERRADIIFNKSGRRREARYIREEAGSV